MAWITPVYDRTAADVAAGADKCYFSAELLNRVEGNLAYLADMLGVEITTRVWVATDFLTPGQMQRILGNLATVRTAYFARPGDPDIPAMPCVTWHEINAVEQIIYGIRDLWDRNRAYKRYTGELSAGEMGVM